MNRAFLLIGALAIMLVNCGKEEKNRLQAQIDSLTTELKTSEQFAITLAEVGMLMDSIDANRQVLRINMMEGIMRDNYTSRMEDLNNYVKEIEKKMSDLGNLNKKPKPNSIYFTSILDNLKEEVDKKNQELATIQIRIAKYQTENENLIKINEKQLFEIFSNSEQLNYKTQELAQDKTYIQQLIKQSKISDAEQYYARGLAVETAANRIKLNPRKKMTTLKEALDFYQKSFSLGHQPAKAKIDHLQKLLK